MVLKSGIIALLLVLILPSVLAATTPITIHTAPDTFVMVRVYKANEKIDTLQSIIDTPSGLSGTVEITHESAESSIDVEVFIKLKRNGRAEFYKRFGPFTAGEPISLTLPEENNTDEEPVAAKISDNATIPETTAPAETQSTTSAQSNDNPAPVTGQVISGMPDKKTLSVIIGGIVLVGALAYISYLFYQKGGLSGLSVSGMFKSMPGAKSAPRGFRGESPGHILSELNQTKRELESTRRELQSLRNRDKIKEAEARIEREKEELRRLRSGL